MSAKDNLKGATSRSSKIALLLIDLMNDFDYPEGGRLFKYARPAAENIVRLKKRAKSRGIPVIYVNDNFGKWQSNFKKIIDHCRQTSAESRQLVDLLEPDDDDYFVLKPKHSGFYSTTLELLLEHLQVETLILTGIATDICILFTASDAYMRGYRILVPADCVAASDPAESDWTLRYLQKTLQADIRHSDKLSLDKYEARGA